MKNLSVKNLKKTTRSLYLFKAAASQSGNAASRGTDPTITTTTLTTTTHFAR